MKKILSLSLVLLLILPTLLCGCGSTTVNTVDRSLPVVNFEELSSRSDLMFTFPEPDDFVITASNAVYAADYGTKGNGTADDSAAVKAAVAAASGKAVIFEAGTYRLSSDVTVPNDVALVFAAGASISIDSGKTLTVNSSSLTAPFDRIFAGNGTVAYMPNIAAVKLEWFGGFANDNADDSAALEKAMFASKTVVLGAGRYNSSKTASIPTAHDVSIVGAGNSATFLIASSTNPAVFSNSTGGSRRSFYIGFLQAQSSQAGTSMLVDYSGNGTVTAENMYIRYFGTAFKLTGTSNSKLYNLDIQAGSIGLIANNCKNTLVEGTLCHDGEGFIRANGGSDLTVLDSSGVWNYATDYEIKNFKNFIMTDSSTDLGYNHRDHAANRYAMYFENVDGFSIRGCWLATNGGLSGAYNPSTLPHILSDGERTGLYIKSSQNGVIAGNSIGNHTSGIQIVNSPANAGEIVIEGNSLNGNGKRTTMSGAAMPGTRCCILLNNANNITVMMNFFNRYRSGFGETELICTGSVTNVGIIGNSFSNCKNQATLESTTPGAAYDSNMFGI